MPYTTKATFEVKYLQILDEKGECDEKLLGNLLTKEEMLKLYTWMWQIRLADDQAIKFQRMGKCGTYASALGQEAAALGAAYALKPEDVSAPSFREQGAFIARGLPLLKVVQYWGGTEQGSIFEGAKMFPISIPVGSQSLHAVGAAFAFKLRNEKRVAMAFFGDGGTSEGDVSEAMNFAGVHKLPIIFVCQNNQFAISVARSIQTAAQTIAQKAIAFGFEGVQVDGNDVFAVYKAARDAVDKARKGDGPTFIECYTYRMADHTTADDATRYRDPKELDYWKQRDPIERLRTYLKKKKYLDEKKDKEILEFAQKETDKMADDYLNTPAEDPHVIFKHVFEKMTPTLEREMKEFDEYLAQKGEQK